MLGIGKELLSRYRWWRFERHPEWVEPHWTSENSMQPYAAGIPGEVRIIYTPANVSSLKLKGLEADVQYTGKFFDPASGREQAFGPVATNAGGEGAVPVLPTIADWVVILEKKRS
jgi:hypothetical protein